MSFMVADRQLLDDRFSLVYEELRRLAARVLRGEHNAKLTPTTLVHETWLKLAHSPEIAGTAPLHFRRIAARAMRQVLVDHERHRRADKRDGGERITLTSLDLPDPSRAVDLLALDEALNGLEKLDPRKARVIELRVFGGMDFADVAQALDISRATLARDFRTARAWLYRALELDAPLADA